MMRQGVFERRTKETEVRVRLELDGEGRGRISTPIPFLNHMLELFAKHSGFDLDVEARGDVEVDPHHTVEDVGIALGGAIGQAIGDKGGIARFGFCILPMDEALCLVSIDLSGRPLFVMKGRLWGRAGGIGGEAVRQFLRALASEARCTIHVKVFYGDDTHHMIEAVFKALGRALRGAVAREGKGIPSTKGVL